MKLIISSLILCSIGITLRAEDVDLKNIKPIIATGPACVGAANNCPFLPHAVCKATGMVLTIEECAKQCPSGCTPIN